MDNELTFHGIIANERAFKHLIYVFVYTTPILLVRCGIHHYWSLRGSIRHTHTHTHTYTDTLTPSHTYRTIRILAFRFCHSARSQIISLLPYLFKYGSIARWEGINAFMKTNPLCLHPIRDSSSNWLSWFFKSQTQCCIFISFLPLFSCWLLFWTC